MIAFFNAVNTYTDASIVKIDKTFITCAGFVTTFQGEIIDSGTKIVSDATNNYGEILAIQMGIKSLLSFKEYDCFLNLFSDSRISVLGLTEWIYNWLRNMDTKNHILINSSGQEVANQDVFCNIIHYIVQHNTHLSIYHQRGHKNPSDVNDMEEVRKSFLEINNTEITEDIIREICYYNDMVDNITRNKLTEVTGSPNFGEVGYRRHAPIAKRVLNNNTMNIYKKLVGG